MRTLGPGSVSSFLKIILDVAYVLLWVILGLMGLLALLALLLSFNPEFMSSSIRIDGEEKLPNGPTMAAGLAAASLYFGGVLVIVGRLRRIFVTLTAGDPFHPDNVRRLRVIGLVLAALELGRYLFTGIAVLLPGINEISGGLNLTTWFSVLVVFVLAEVFREGARLRREAELTI